MKEIREVWVGEFEGHKIKVTNSGKAKLWIDGVEAAKEKGLLHLELELRAPIPGTDYIVIAKLDGAKDLIVNCDVLIAMNLPMTFGKESEEGVFEAYSEDEISKMKGDTEAAAAITAANTILF